MSNQKGTPRQSNLIDLAGRRFSSLVVLGRDGNGTGSRSQLAAWKVKCDCGFTKTVVGNDLRSGHAKSCGCQKSKLVALARTTHGDAARGHHSRLYDVWGGIKSRCANRKNPWYGKRGIRMHPSWAESFETFKRDIGPRPSPKHSIDRIDNDGHYEPGNVRWTTRQVQSDNSRRVRKITFNGRTQSVARWARELGMPDCVLSTRLSRWKSASRALSTPYPAPLRNQWSPPIP